MEAGVMKLSMQTVLRFLLAFLIAMWAGPVLAQSDDENLPPPDEEPEEIESREAELSSSYFSASATSFAPHEKGVELLNKAREISPIAVGNAFGEQISLFDGGGAFSVVDISVPGNNALPVELKRTLRVDDRSRLNGTHLGGFAEWNIDVPYLVGVFSVSSGWATESGGASQRCSIPGSPPSYPSGVAEDYWDGYQMHVPGQGNQTLLYAPSVQLPAVSGTTTYPWITKGMWRLSCKPSTANGAVGEAFLALAPDGTKYHFDWMIAKAHATYRNPGLVNSSGISRQAVYFLVTKIEDRFGNWVNYNYSGDKLVSISSSDSRQITLNYSGSNVSSASSSIGSWSYVYSGEKLAQVIRPDASRWLYASTGALKLIPPATTAPIEDPSGCPELLEEYTGAYSISITAPYGAVGVFSFEPRQHFNNNTPDICHIMPPSYWYRQVPQSNWVLALVSKAISGPGISPASWNYEYSSGLFAFSHVRHTVVTGPGGAWERHEFGNAYGVNAGQLLKLERGYGTSAILDTQTNTYLSTLEAAGQNFPSSVGVDPRGFSDPVSSTWLRPLKSTSVNRQGTTFTRIVDSNCGGKFCYDVFARPSRQTRSSTLGYSRTDLLAYYDHLPSWTLGQHASSTHVGTGYVESQILYDPIKALPTSISEFGKVKQQLTWNSDGTIASVSDGGGNSTSLSNWHRGIPRTVVNADSTSLVSTVNNAGLITAVTNENGFTTSYGYDAMGRVSSIAYPGGDTTAWNSTSQMFEQINAAEYGIPSGHWRQTVATGNARKVTYFDGLWRPLLTHEYDAANQVGTQRYQRSSYNYDAQGEIKFESYPGITDALTTGKWAYFDVLGRPRAQTTSSEIGLLTTTIEYLAGFQTRTTNPRGQSTIQSHMAWDQPAGDYPVMISQPGGVYTDIARDAFAKPTSITQRNGSGSETLTRRYVYNGHQQLCRTIEPESGSTVMAYDNAGNLSWSASGQALPAINTCETESVASHQKVSRSYDVRNRLTSLAFPDGNGSQSWTYTADGLPETVTTWNEGGSTFVSNSYTYNRRRLVTGESQAQTGGQSVWSIGYGYNSNGHLASLVHPQNLIVDYLPNALGQPTQAGIFATGVQYHPSGAIKQFTYGNGLVHTMSQNARQLPARSTDSGGVLDLAYSYDANGNVGSISDYTSAGRQTRTMSYDVRDRLASVGSILYPGGANYSYDALDNIARATVGGRDYVYWYDTHNRLTNVLNGVGGPTAIGIGYDSRGNVSNKNGSLFQFDHGNRLRNAQGAESYRYDAQGRRVRTAGADGLLYEMYSLDGKLLWQRDEQLGLRFQHVYLGGSLIASRRMPIGQTEFSTIYRHTDALGSPIAATDELGSILQTTEHEPYGKMLNRNNDNRPGYTGHVVDKATGLVYMQQRYYDPQIGRFLSVDPVTADGNTGGNFNRYWYANNNPYKFTDPDGRLACTGDNRVGCQEQIRELEQRGIFPLQAGGGSGNKSKSDCPECDEVRSTRAGIMRDGGERLMEAGAYGAREGAMMFGGGVLGKALGRVGRFLGFGSKADDVAFRSDTSHIFRNARGHLADDTPANRTLLQGAVRPGNLVRTEGPNGSVSLYREVLPDGRQVWVKVRGGEITNAGVNTTPLP